MLTTNAKVLAATFINMTGFPSVGAGAIRAAENATLSTGQNSSVALKLAVGLGDNTIVGPDRTHLRDSGAIISEAVATDENCEPHQIITLGQNGKISRRRYQS